jgi:uncharacterized protein YbaP (TraB family)
MNAKIEKAFSRSALLAVEVNPSALPVGEFLRLLAARAVYRGDDSLEKHLSPATLSLAKGWFAARGMAWDQARRMKPWALAMIAPGMRGGGAALTAAYGIDQYFMNKAKGAKPVVDLEYAEDQFDLLNEIPDPAQDAMLKDAVSGGEDSDLDAVVRAWRTGDEKALEALLEPMKTDPQTAAFYTKVFDRRNQKMAEQIEEILRAGRPAFIVVGAGHLVGDKSVVRYLARTCKVVRQ